MKTRVLLVLSFLVLGVGCGKNGEKSQATSPSDFGPIVIEDNNGQHQEVQTRRLSVEEFKNREKVLTQVVRSDRTDVRVHSVTLDIGWSGYYNLAIRTSKRGHWDQEYRTREVYAGRVQRDATGTQILLLNQYNGTTPVLASVIPLQINNKTCAHVSLGIAQQPFVIRNYAVGFVVCEESADDYSDDRYDDQDEDDRGRGRGRGHGRRRHGRIGGGFVVTW
jgi:hypothetical protein